MIKLNIDVTKIPRERIRSKPAWKGKFLSLVLVDKPDEKWDGFIKIDLSKAEREAGQRGEIIGNWQDTDNRRGQPQPQSRPPREPHASELQHGEEDIPF